MPTISSRTCRSLALTAALFLVISCSEETGGAQPLAHYDGKALQRLELTTLGEVELEIPVDRQAQEWPNLGEEGSTDDWNFGGAKTRRLELDGESILTIYRKDRSLIQIPASLTLRDTPQLTFDLVVRNQGFTIGGKLLKDGVVQSSAELEVIKSRNFQTLAMTFPPVTGESLKCDMIHLEIPRGEHPFGLRALSFEDVALGGYLPPEAFGGLALVEIGTDARRGTCISTEIGARTQFKVSEEVQELVLSYATPRSIMRSGPPPQLRVTVEGSGVERSQVEAPFAGDDQSPPSWRELSIPLGQFVGEEVEARFELISTDDSKRLAVIGSPQLVARRESPPTVLLISSDTHRSDHLGFLSGADGPRTEMIDRLAAEGVAFLDATSSINNTTPSHVALFTGLNPRDTGIVANAIRLAEAAPTLAECFAELGYATLAAVSAAPVCSQFSGLGQGFDRYSNPGYRSARDSEETLAQLMSWLPDYEGRPLFVWLHVYDAHSPYDPPPEFITPYYPEHLKPRDPGSPVANFDLAPDWDPDIADPVYTESAYKAEVSYVDHRLTELLSLDRFWNGTIAFTADHGETLRNGEENRFGHRGLSHSNLAVPMIFKAKGIGTGVRRAAPVQQIDVGRTLLDLAGHPEVEFPGTNVFQVSEQDDSPRFAMQANGFSASILSGKWMLLLGLRPTRSSGDERRDWFHNVTLHDIEVDEACRTDLSEQDPVRTARMRKMLVRWLEDSRRNNWETAAIGDQDEIAKKLTELGYASMENGERSSDWIEIDCSCENCTRFD